MVMVCTLFLSLVLLGLILHFRHLKAEMSNFSFGFGPNCKSCFNVATLIFI